MPALRQSGRKLTIAAIAALTGSRLKNGGAAERRIGNIASLDSAGAADLCVFDHPRLLQDLAQTRAGACLIAPQFAGSAPPRLAVLINDDPYRAFVIVARALFPEALRPSSLFGTSGRAPGAHVHHSARIEAGVTIDPLAVIGPRAEVGAGTLIAAGAAIGPDVCVGRHCAIGAGASVLSALIGDRVVLGPGARLGQAGTGHWRDLMAVESVPHTKRVIVQDAVEIGANATVDRGALRDTVLGEGTRVGNLARIAQDAIMGRHCALGPQSAVGGGVTIGDFVVINERASVADDLVIGDRASITQGSMVNIDLLAGARFDGAVEASGSGR